MFSLRNIVHLEKSSIFGKSCSFSRIHVLLRNHVPIEKTAKFRCVCFVKYVPIRNHPVDVDDVSSRLNVLEVLCSNNSRPAAAGRSDWQRGDCLLHPSNSVSRSSKFAPTRTHSRKPQTIPSAPCVIEVI